MKRKTELRRKTPLKRRAPLRAKRPPERVTARAGLLWRNGAPIPLPEADTVARAHGYVNAEEMVRALRDGTESVRVRKARKPLRRSKPDPVYEKAVREWWSGHDERCEMRYNHEGIHLPRVPDGFDPSKTIDTFRCSRAANPRPHHMKRRGKFKCDINTFLGLCRACHIDWLHNNEEEARRLGYLTDRKPKPTP